MTPRSRRARPRTVRITHVVLRHQLCGCFAVMHHRAVSCGWGRYLRGGSVVAVAIIRFMSRAYRRRRVAVAAATAKCAGFIAYGRPCRPSISGAAGGGRPCVVVSRASFVPGESCGCGDRLPACPGWLGWDQHGAWPWAVLLVALQVPGFGGCATGSAHGNPAVVSHVDNKARLRQHDQEPVLDVGRRLPQHRQQAKPKMHSRTMPGDPAPPQMEPRRCRPLLRAGGARPRYATAIFC